MTALFSRRQFMLAAGASLAALPLRLSAQAPLTAGVVINRIKDKVGLPWNNATYRDTIKIGRPETRVRGIATTFMSTYDVIRQAHAAGMNFVVTHEPTFWSDGDVVGDLTRDALYQEKLKFAEANGMVIWRFHDHWHARMPDGIFVGWKRALGWEGYAAPENDRRFVIPETTLGQLAAHVASALQSRGVRMVGNPSTRIRTVTRGAHTLVGNLAAVPTADALIVSEAREWTHNGRVVRTP